MPTPLPQEQNQQATPLPQTEAQTSAPDGDDFLRPILDPVQADNSVKSQAWQAWHASKSSEDFQKAFENINIPRETKSALWNLRFKPSPEQLQQMLPAYSRQYGVDPELMRRVIQQESGWKQYDPAGQPLTNAKSGAMGLTQLMPETAQRWGVDPRDPIANLQGGIQEFAQRYKESGGDLNKALAAYGGFVTKDPSQYTGAITKGYQPPPAQAAPAAQAPPSQTLSSAMPGMFGQGPSQGLTPQQEQIAVGQSIPNWMTAPLAKTGHALEAMKAPARWYGKQMGEAFGGFLTEEQTPFQGKPGGVGVPSAVGRAIGETIGETVADPTNWPFLASGTARPLLQRLISGGFAAQMGTGSAEQLYDLYQNWDKYSTDEKAERIAKSGLQAWFAQQSGTHMGGPITDVRTGQVSPGLWGGARPGVWPESAQPGVSMGQEPARVQAVPQAAPSVAQEGGPRPVTQAGVTGAQEVTGGRVPAIASAPIEGAGRAAGTGAPDTGERRMGPQVSLPPGFERRGIKTPEQVQAEAGQNLAAQDTAAEARRQAYGQEERKRQARLRIDQDPELFKAFRKASPSEKEALLAHVAGLQIQALQPPAGGAQPRPFTRTSTGARIAERTPGVPQAPTSTSTPANIEPVRGPEVAARPAGESVQPKPAAGGQPLPKPEQVAAGKPAYKPLPPEQRPFVPAGGGAPRFAQPKPEAAPPSIETRASRSEVPTQPAQQAVPAPLVPRGAEPEATARVQSEKAQGIERIRIDTRSGKEYPVARSVGMEDVQPGPYDRIIKRYPDGREEQVAEGAKARPTAGPTRPAKAAAGTVDQTLTRYLKKTEADEARVPGGRLDELGKAIGRERAKGPEQARSTAVNISDRGDRAQSYLDSINRIEKSADWEKEATDILHERIPKGEVDEQTGKFIVGRKWEGEEGVKGGTRTGGLDFSATFLREANPRRAEVLGNLLGLKQREVGKPTEWLEQDPKEKLAGLQKQYQTLMEQTRAEGGRPSDERLAQLEKLMEGIHALRGTRRIAVDEKGHPLGPEDMLGKTGERIPAGSRASRAFLAELMGPRWSAKGHWARPTAEQFAARRAELENEIKWSKNTARALTEGLPGAEAAPVPRSEASTPASAAAGRPLKRLAGREVTGPAPKEFYKEIAKAAGLTYVGESSPGVHRFDDAARAGRTFDIPEKDIPETGAVKYLREQVAKFAEAPKTAPAKETLTPQQPRWGEKNTKFTKDKLQAAREKFRNAGKTSYTGLDPELVKALTDIVGYHFEAGLRKFSDLAEQVVADLGEHVRPYLQDIYNQVKAGFEGAKTPTAGLGKPVEPSKLVPATPTARPTTEAPKKGGFLRIREDVPEARPKAPVREQRVQGGVEKQEIVEQKREQKREQRREAVSPAAKARYEAESREQRTKFEQAKAAHQARLDEVRQLRAVDPQDYTPAFIDRLAKFGQGLKDAEGRAEFLGKVEEARTGFSTGDDRAGHAAVTSALAMADQRLLEPRPGKLFAGEVKAPAKAAPVRVSTAPEAPREPGIGKRVFDAFGADGQKGLREFTDAELREAREHVGAGTQKGIDTALAARGAEKTEIAKIAPETRPAVQAPKKGEHVQVSVPPPEGTGGKADTGREQVYNVARRIDDLPRGEDRNALAKRINAFSKTLESLNEQLKWTNQAVRQMRESGENVRTRTNKVTGEKKTETLQQLEMRLMKVRQARNALLQEKKAPAKGVQKGAPAYDTIAAIRDTVSALEKPAVTKAPEVIAPTDIKPRRIPTYGHERVLNEATGRLEAQLAPQTGERVVTPSPAPKEEGVQQRIEQLKREIQHLANLRNKFGGQPTRSAAIDINRLKKSIRAIAASIPKGMLPELPENVRAAVAGGQILERAARKEYVSKPREGEVIEAREGEFRTGELQGNNAEDLNRWLGQNAEKGIPPAISKYVDENFRKAGPAADLIAQHIMQAARAGKFGDIRGDEAPARAATRLYRALDALFQGRIKALSLSEGERASAKEQALQDSIDIARSGEKNPETLAQKRARLAREKPGERGFFSLEGKKAREGAEGAISRLFGKKAAGQQASGDRWIDRMREKSDAFKAARVLDDILREAKFQQQGMTQRIWQGLDDLPKVRGLQQAVYKMAERSAKSGEFPDPAFQKVFDEHIRDWADLLEQRYLQHKSVGNDAIVEQYQKDNYTPKYAMKKNTMWDRLFRGTGKWTVGSVLNQSASALKGRSFFRLEAPGIPSDTIVHVDKGGNLTLWENGKPTPLGSTKEEMEADGFKFSNALTDDVKKHNGQDYLQHLYLTTAMKAAELDNAWRAHEILEAYKESPDFKKYAVQTARGAPIPDGWRHTQVPQLQGYAFEKHTADVLDRYYKSLNKENGNILDKFNYGLVTTLYLNPLKHAFNELDHFTTQVGLGLTSGEGWLNPKTYAPMARSFKKAWHAVWDGNHDWFYALDQGMPGRGRTITNKQMSARIVKEILPMKWNAEKNTWEEGPEASGIAKAWGYANPVQMARSYLEKQRRGLFGMDDILRLTATYYHQELTGDAFKDSWREVGKHLPEYEIPTHVGLRIPFTDIDYPSRTLARIFDNPLVVFGRYHYGKLKSWGYTAQDMLSRDENITWKDRRVALDRLLVPLAKMAFYTYVGNKMIQKLTGKKDAEMRASGATAIPATALRVVQGKTTIPHAMMSEVTPSPLVDWAGKLGWGISSRGPKPLKEQVKDIVGVKGDLTRPSRLKLTGGLLGEIGPVREAEQTRRGIAGQVDWGEVARRNLFDVYSQKSNAPAGRGLPKLPHFPRTR